MINKKIFITYNSNRPDEQTLAIRLYTIGVANGFMMYLPDRFNPLEINTETKRRIDDSEYVIIFALSDNLSPIVIQELDYAFFKLKDKSKIIVIYNTQNSIEDKFNKNFTSIYYNPMLKSMDNIIHEIIGTITNKEKESTDKENSNNLIALIGIGLGLAALSYFIKKDD